MIEDDLRFLGASPAIRSALSALPLPFAEAVAADAVRVIQNEALPARPVDPEDFHLPPIIRTPLDRHLIESGAFPDGLASPAFMRWRCVKALLSCNAGLLTAACNGFRYVLAAWEAAHGSPPVPDGPDCPPVALAEWFPGMENA